MEKRGIADYQIWINQNDVTFYQPKIIEKDFEHLPNNWLDDEKSLTDACPEIYQFFRKKPLPY